jgi:zinc transporter, ZIP family
MIETNTLLLAFGLTLFAGLSTGIGGLLACCTKRTNTKLLSVALGFSAGVMIYISFVEIFKEAKEMLILEFNEPIGHGIAILAFFGGMLVAALIDRLLPNIENPHEIHHVEEMANKKEAKRQRKLLRMGFVTCIAIAVHNFPEGLVTFASALQDLSLGVVIALAIAIHNIPEGIAVSIPIFYATGSKKKALTYSFLSGFAEPLGALVGYFTLSYFFNGTALGILFASVAGIMIFISFDQLLPTAREYGEHHLSLYGLIGGMAVMAVSLLLL